MQNQTLLKYLVLCLALTTASAETLRPAVPAGWSLVRDARSFDRAGLEVPENLERVRAAGNLAGKANANVQADGTHDPKQNDAKIGNVFLRKGRHTLRVQQNTFWGFEAITETIIRQADADPGAGRDRHRHDTAAAVRRRGPKDAAARD
jgi:hypothetical protein